MSRLLLAVMIALTAAASTTAAERKPHTGMPLPDFTLMDQQGKQHRLSSFIN